MRARRLLATALDDEAAVGTEPRAGMIAARPAPVMPGLAATVVSSRSKNVRRAARRTCTGTKAAGRRRHTPEDEIALAKARVHAIETRVTLGQHHSAEEQHERQRDLDADEHVQRAARRRRQRPRRRRRATAVGSYPCPLGRRPGRPRSAKSRARPVAQAPSGASTRRSSVNGLPPVTASGVSAVMSRRAPTAHEDDRRRERCRRWRA